MASKKMTDAQRARLNRRRKAAKWKSKGLDNKAIAAKLGTSVSTVRNDLHWIEENEPDRLSTVQSAAIADAGGESTVDDGAASAAAAATADSGVDAGDSERAADHDSDDSGEHDADHGDGGPTGEQESGDEPHVIECAEPVVESAPSEGSDRTTGLEGDASAGEAGGKQAVEDLEPVESGDADSTIDEDGVPVDEGGAVADADGRTTADGLEDEQVGSAAGRVVASTQAGADDRGAGASSAAPAPTPRQRIDDAKGFLADILGVSGDEDADSGDVRRWWSDNSVEVDDKTGEMDHFMSLDDRGKWAYLVDRVRNDRIECAAVAFLIVAVLVFLLSL